MYSWQSHTQLRKREAGPNDSTSAVRKSMMYVLQLCCCTCMFNRAITDACITKLAFTDVATDRGCIHITHIYTYIHELTLARMGSHTVAHCNTRHKTTRTHTLQQSHIHVREINNPTRSKLRLPPGKCRGKIRVDVCVSGQGEGDRGRGGALLKLEVQLRASFRPPA